MTPRPLGDLLDEVAGLSAQDLVFQAAYNSTVTALVTEAYERGRYDMGHGWNARRHAIPVMPDEGLTPLPSMPPRSPRTAPGAFLG